MPGRTARWWHGLGILLFLLGLGLSFAAPYGFPLVAWFGVQPGLVVGLLTCGMLGACGGVLVWKGITYVNRGRQGTTRIVSAPMAFSGPAPVLYLRSFRDDANTARTLLQPQGMLLPSFATQEEQISMVMHPIGPLLAIGRPGERLPELGASRLYVRDEVWQETIEHLMRRARLVVLYAGDTEGFWWEVHRAVRLLRPEQLVFLILYNAAHYAQFRQRAEAVLPCQLPAYQGRRFAGNVLQGLIYVTSDWVAHFIPLKHHWWRGYFLRPLASSLHMALRPVFTQLHVPWQKPPIQWKLARALVGMLVLTWLYAKILLALLR